MKNSEKDKWLDRMLSRAAEANKNKHIPDFDKWLKENPDAIRSLKLKASLPRDKNSQNNVQVNHKLLMVRLPLPVWLYRIAALFFIAALLTFCFILFRENRMLKQDLQLARQELALNNQQRQIVEAQNNQQQAISELHTRVKKLEQDVHRSISPRMARYLEEPYYTPEYQGQL